MNYEQIANGHRYYIALNCDKQSSDYLKNWCLKNNFDLTTSYDKNKIDVDAFDFHTTLMYSENKSRYPIKTGDTIVTPVTMTVKGITLFGMDSNIPVLIMEPSEIILSLRKYIENYYGLKDSWGEYKPHITISYNYNGNPILTEIIQSIIDAPITYDLMVVRHIEDK